jgi:PAS domain S-box-containing protein
MPNFDAMAALEVLKKSGLDIPFIIVSGSIGEDIAVSAMKAGAHDYIMKGTPARLAVAIERELRDAVTRADRRRAEEAVRESEGKYRILLESLQEGIWKIDADSRTTFVNAHMADMLGYTVEEMAGKSLFDFMDEEGKRDALNKVAHRKEGIREQHDFVFVRKDGSRLFAVLETAPLTDNDGRYIGAIAGVIDVTERRRAEEALSESDRRFRAMVEKGTDVVVLVDNTGLIKYASPAFKTSLGRDTSDVEGRPSFDFIEKFVHPDDREDTLNAFSALLDSPGAEGHAECRFMHGDGMWHHIVAVGKNHLHDPALNGIVLNIRDITEQKRAGEALRESEHKYRQLFEEMMAGYALQEMVLDGKGEPLDYITLEVNPEFERLLGVKKEQVIGRRATEAEPRLDRAWIQMFCRVALTGQPCRYTQYASNLDKHFEGSAYSPRKGQVAVTFLDVTERIKNEEKLKASLQEKETLLQEIHHRVKNNLQVISSLLSTQTRHIKDPEAIKAFKESQSRIRSMALIHERMYHARDLSRVDFTEYADRLVAGLMTAYNVKPETIVAELNVQRVFLGIDTAVPCGLLLNELVSNCLKHAFPKGRKGEIKVALEKTPEGALRLSVSDNGVGLPEGVDPLTADTMGMQIVSALADQLDAKMEVAREGGTRFTLTFKPDERSPLAKKRVDGDKSR